MSESAPSDFTLAAMEQGADPVAAIVSLRGQGADRFNPVRFRFIEALAQRAGRYGGKARRFLDEKLTKSLAEYCKQFEQAKREAGETLRRASGQFPDAARDLELINSTGDFNSLRRAIARLEGRCRRVSLAELVGHTARHAPGSTVDTLISDGAPNGEPHAELKSLSYFRHSWSKLSVDQQLSRALEQGPDNAGPLNSHLLVLESLKLMRAISPDYLKRFMSYADALLWLDQANGTIPMPKTPLRGESDKKRKSSRAKSE